MFPALLCVVIICALLITRAMRLPVINAVSAYSAPWLIGIVVAVWFGGISDRVLDLTWGMLLVSFLATALGAWVGWAWPARNTRGLGVDPSPPVALESLRSKHRILTWVLACSVAIQFITTWPSIQSFGGLSAVFDGGGNAYRQAAIADSLEKAQSEAGAGGIGMAIVTYALFIVGMSSLFTGAVLWVQRFRVAAVMPVVLSSAISVLTLQRTSVVLSALLFGFAIVAVKWSGVAVQQRAPKRALRRKSKISGIIAGFAAMAGAVWFLVFLSGSRGQTGGQSVLATFGDYMLGGLAGLNARNSQGGDWAPLRALDGGSDPSPGMGGYTFGGLWSFLERLGVPLEQTRFNLDFTRVTIFGERTITNVASALGEYYLDFRWWGILVIPAALGFLISRLQRHVLRDGAIGFIPALAYLLTVAVWCFFGSWFSDVRLMLLAVLGGYILKWAMADPESVARPVPTKPHLSRLRP